LTAQTIKTIGTTQLKIVFPRRVSIAPAITWETIITRKTSPHISVSCRLICLKRGEDQNCRGLTANAPS
jgi:hypothetical protein